jgi:hypothetical protein
VKDAPCLITRIGQTYFLKQTFYTIPRKVYTCIKKEHSNEGLDYCDTWYRMINLIGFLIVVCGFFAPFLSSGTIPASVFFWVGFLLLLWSNKFALEISTYLKWARIGLLLNVSGTFLLFLLSSLAVNTSLFSNYFGFIILKGAHWIINPITSLIAFFFPYDQVTMPDGSIRFSQSFIRAILSEFFDVLTYIVLALLIGKLLSARKLAQET